MDPLSLIAPAVVAAAVSATVSLIATIVSSRTTRRNHQERVKFEADIAERKVKADIDLAQKKFDLDRQLAAWNRNTAIAEAVLEQFYKARTILLRLVFHSAGATRALAARDPITKMNGKRVTKILSTRLSSD